MQTIKVIDDGLVPVQVGEDGTTVTLDLYRTNNRLAEICNQQGKSTEQINEEVLDFMETLGFPRGSHRLACKFADSIFAATKQSADEIKKNGSGGQTPSSPASTAPELSD